MKAIKEVCPMKKLINRLLFVIFKGGLISMFLSLIRIKLSFWAILVILAYLITSELDRLSSENKLKNYIFNVWRKRNGTVNK
jgi:hypothetical protein